MIKKVFIAGGTGFLGYHAALLFLKMKVKVDTVALPDEIDLKEWFSDEIQISYLNLFTSTDQEIYSLLENRNYDVFIYALGPDDRYIPKRPAITFFNEYLVNQSKRICLQAKKAGIPKCVILSSYFVEFANSVLIKHHPYIKARVKQIEAINQLADNQFSVSYLLLPYIFGTMPNREPLWKKHFLDHFTKLPSVFFPKGGGTTVVDASGVAQAIVAASMYGENKVAYCVGKENLSFSKLITYMLESLGENKKYKEIPSLFCAIGTIPKMIQERWQNKQNGLHLWYIMFEILNQTFYTDFKKTERLLHYESLHFDGGIDVFESIKQTMEAIKKMW